MLDSFKARLRNETLIGPIISLPCADVADLLCRMHVTRFFKEAAFQQYSLGRMHGTMQLCANQALVTQDMLGMFKEVSPRFLKVRADMASAEAAS